MSRPAILDHWDMWSSRNAIVSVFVTQPILDHWDMWSSRNWGDPLILSQGDGHLRQAPAPALAPVIHAHLQCAARHARRPDELRLDAWTLDGEWDAPPTHASTQTSLRQAPDWHPPEPIASQSLWLHLAAAPSPLNAPPTAAHADTQARLAAPIHRQSDPWVGRWDNSPWAPSFDHHSITTEP